MSTNQAVHHSHDIILRDIRGYLECLQKVTKIDCGTDSNHSARDFCRSMKRENTLRTLLRGCFID